ncbi:MAG: hypothetical protein RBT65_12870 [Methanolobus sp.]|nr:hypothetical protein [Methanolobus sp.]
MLTSTITTTAASTISSAVGTVSMTTSVGLPEYGVLAAVALILLLSAKEILSASEKWNKSLNCSLNMAILPLGISFAAIVFFKISEII